MFKHILLATDGSPASEKAVAMAVDLARTHGAKITAVYVIDPYPYIGIGDTNPMGLQAYMSAAQDHAAQAHAHVEALCEAANPRVELQLRLLEDVATAKGIVQCANDEQADLIVAGSHGRSGLSGLLLGSVSSKLVTLAQVPVLVVR
ncbi:universal stress protein [Caenimonas koreensis]|uniref:Universal stress protein n=1 Tax=Caenimonas koreensis DSM 17982 TaxID=1121255 RepID=A0A844AU78_9BURK|nr:universal stress protein [Caenimonas koreensis]MRD47905.1 universal stress protein [Caenimonas koreensis DSM 17982]